MLMIVHPAPKGQGKPKKRHGAKADALLLSADEIRHVRAAARATSRAYGGCARLAAALAVPIGKVREACAPNGRAMSGTFAIRLAKLAGMTVEAVLTGKLTEAGTCPTCGARVASSCAVAGGAS